MKRLGERLVEAGLIAAGAVDQALAHQQVTGLRLGDCLVELRLINETVLLKFLAHELKTKFVSAEKLAKAKLAPEVLDKVPVRMCEAQDFMPIAFDQERRLLSVVMAEPQNAALVREIALVTDVTEVSAFVGVRAAIHAGIRKHYYGDPTAFSALEHGGSQGFRGVPRMSLPDVGGQRSSDSRVVAMRTVSKANPTQLREALGVVRGTVGENDFTETLNIMVGLLEMPRGPFRSHSAQVARQAGLLARRLGLPPREVMHTTIAAQLHEVGKSTERHLTLPLMAVEPALRSEAKRQLRAPITLFETVHLHGGVNAILAQLYEAFDGSGLPQGAKNEEIAIGARILAAVDAFFELTRNPQNHLGHVVPKPAAVEMMRSHAGTLFDPKVVDALAVLQSGDLLKQRVENDGRQVFLAEPAETTRSELADALAKRGLVVHSVERLEAVVDAFHSGEADTVAVSLAYGVTDLVALTTFARARPESAGVPVIVLGEPTEASAKDRLTEAGVTAFVHPTEMKAASERIQAAFVDHREHGAPSHLVRGSFDELAPLELLGALGSGRKSGRLTVRHATHEGFIHLEHGRVISATWGELKGEAAFIDMFGSALPDFQFDADAVPLELPNLDKDVDVLARQLSK